MKKHKGLRIFQRTFGAFLFALTTLIIYSSAKFFGEITNGLVWYGVFFYGALLLIITFKSLEYLQDSIIMMLWGKIR